MSFEFTYIIAGLTVAIFALAIAILAHSGVKRSKSSRR